MGTPKLSKWRRLGTASRWSALAGRCEQEHRVVEGEEVGRRLPLVGPAL